MNIETYIGYPDKRLALDAAFGAAISRVTRRQLRRRLAPGLSELAAATSELHGSAFGLLSGAPTVGLAMSAPELADLSSEHEAVLEKLRCRYATSDLAFPSSWAVEIGTSFVLYALVRTTKPAVVVEMGVGNGQSSFCILQALAANNRGTLFSFDIEPAAGALLTEADTTNWEFRLVSRWNSGRSIARHLQNVPDADLSFHDAGHGYLAQSFEFACLWRHLSARGILVSDDVDASYAFIDFCATDAKHPAILVDRRKAVGIVRRTGKVITQ